MVEALLAAGAAKVYAATRAPGAIARGDARLVPVVLDVTDEDAVRAAAKQASDARIVFNNAGVLEWVSILDVSEESIQRNLAVNLFGTLRMARHFAPIIRENGGGAIVNVLTLLALVSMPGAAAYKRSTSRLRADR